MFVDDLGEIVATRRLCVVDDGKRKEVEVLLGMPRKLQGGEDYACPVLIKGLGNERIRSIVGVDGFQAIQLAIKFIGVELNAHGKTGKHIQWEGSGKEGDLGFPLSGDIS
jgi:hypothetical protein